LSISIAVLVGEERCLVVLPILSDSLLHVLSGWHLFHRLDLPIINLLLNLETPEREGVVVSGVAATTSPLLFLIFCPSGRILYDRHIICLVRCSMLVLPHLWDPPLYPPVTPRSCSSSDGSSCSRFMAASFSNSALRFSLTVRGVSHVVVPPRSSRCWCR